MIELPPPLEQAWPLREVDPDRVAIQRFERHRVRLTIDHEPLEGISPDDLLWWFRSIGGDMHYRGERVPRYRVWHPLDHVSWALRRAARGGGAGEGARFHIVEAFQRDPRLLIDTVDTVEKLDRTGIRLSLRIAGQQVFQLEHTWSAGRGRTHYVSVLDLGSRLRLLAPLNAHLRRRVFRPEMDAAWIRHNVEEVGVLEHLIPDLRSQISG